MITPISNLSRQISNRRVEGPGAVEVETAQAVEVRRPSGVGEVRFDDVFVEAVDGIRTAFKEAKEATTEAMLGRGKPHNAMIAMAKADITFRFATQTRNKVVEAYREMMNMQI